MNPVEPVDPRIRLAIAQWPDDAPRGSVTTFCLEHDLSRKTFYAIRKRAQTEGQAAALEEDLQKVYSCNRGWVASLFAE